MPVAPMMTPIVAAVAARRRRVVRKFEEAGADRPERARTLEELGVRDSHLTSRLIGSGVIAPTDGGRYYLSVEGVERWKRRRNIYVLTAVSVVAVLMIGLALFLRGR